GDRQRIARAGMVPLAPAEGLELFDVALSVRERAVLVPARWNAAVLRARAVEGELAPVLHGLVPASAHRPARSEVPVAVSAGGAAGLRERLVGLGQSEARSVLTDLVRSHAATVLGHTTPDAVPLDGGFLDNGFDSLAAVDLRNRLNTATGLRLPPTLVFDYPTPRSLAQHIGQELLGDGGEEETAWNPSLLAVLDTLEKQLSSETIDSSLVSDIASRLNGLVTLVRSKADEGGYDQDIEFATDEELFSMLDEPFDR
ncbi:phosphopantetheine-binding protein, partial [Streptomyces ipomoeae]|uniref:phosphopantetheine-binding protein n=1 Tax=Streptomyces ipomoeae TaxID=103232 RepID=UPI0029A5C8DA